MSSMNEDEKLEIRLKYIMAEAWSDCIVSNHRQHDDKKDAIS
jgi:hypothetical protein